MLVYSSTYTIGARSEGRTESGSGFMSDMSVSDVLTVFPEKFVVSLFRSCEI